LVLMKKRCTMRAVWQDTLLWCRSQLFIHFSSFSTAWHPSDTSEHQNESHNSQFVIQG
jgi:hypothetical protein